MFFKHFKIGTRLAIAFSTVIALLLVIMVVGTASLDRMSTLMGDMVDQRYAEIALSNTIKANGDKGALIIGRLLLSSTPEQQQRYMDEYAAIRAANTENYKKFEALMQSPESKALFEEQAKARQEYGAVVRKVFDLLKAGDREAALAVYQNETSGPQQKYYALLDRMVERQAQSMAQDSAGARDSARQSKVEMALASLLAALLSAATAWYITRSITQPIGRAIAVAEAVAAGDLTCEARAESDDEVGRLMNALQNMVRSLHRIVSQVRGSADTITSAAQEMSQANRDLSGRTEQQASALQETASAMEQLTSTVRLNADHAGQASQLAVSASEVATQGGDTVGKVVASMGGIAASSQRIFEIINVIDGIAFQTNILSLNAAVEAARAGEQGRGFAVVASEVRALAQRSASAAKEIKALIDASAVQIGEGNRMAERAGATMDQVVAGIKRVSDIVADISASSREQSVGIEQVNAAIASMDTSTQKNAAMVEQGTASAQAMQDQARELAHAVSTFKL
ncbi:methyl-accepting chemotaxis protein [Azohydromonas caseinilytica]|uniref:HAMP domain-containing protein n=1 Tax=Azohydromonas caseinilytica TaxID=2728836 RepID=A0A848FHL0_9BURK|nr:methyl-accepting chemotaxis protein [Azohydromonas caseinilytica]NML18804.1 HAMP domain-containing protein [Azohydromonas caseinilytica]